MEGRSGAVPIQIILLSWVSRFRLLFFFLSILQSWLSWFWFRLFFF